jgi:DNA-binding winged helix-turn-helix (wHTH) protein
MHRASNPVDPRIGPWRHGRFRKTLETHSPAREQDEVHALRFDAFEMDLRSGELRRSGRLVRLQPQPFKVLALLAERPGEVVTREEIQSQVWPAGTFVDFEQSLNFCVRQIRTALGDSAAQPRYVETLPRRGYRWVGGSVERVTPPATVHEWPRPVPSRPLSGDASPAVRFPAPEREREIPWKKVTLGIGLAVAIAGAVTVAYRLGALTERPAPAPHFERITFHRGAVTSARFGPENEVVYVASWEGQPWDAQIVNVGARESRPLQIGHADIVAASPTEVAFLRGGVLQRAPLAGGPAREVASRVIAADWTADTSEFAVVRRHEQRWQLEYPIGRSLGETEKVSFLRLSPDDGLVALAEHPMPGDDRGRVVVINRDGERVTQSGPWNSLTGLAWSPDGMQVWFTAARVGAESELFALDLDGGVRGLHEAMGRLVIHDIAASGRVLLERTGYTAETYYRREGEPGERELSWLDISGVEGMSADGSLVLLVESGDGGGPDYTSYLRPTDGSLPVKLGSGRGTSLSPDGRWALTIPVQKPDHVQIVPTGPGQPRRISIPGAARHETAGWLAGGRAIFIATRDASGQWAWWLVGAEGGEPRPLPLPEGVMLYSNTFSPDGTRFVARCPGEKGFCIYSVEGGEPRALAGAETGWLPLSWDRHDRVYFREGHHRPPEVLWRVDVATGQPERVAEIAPTSKAGVLGLSRVQVSQSGEAWAYSLMRRMSDLYVVTGLR